MIETLQFSNTSRGAEETNRLGPLRLNKKTPLEIGISPLTIFIGPQGSGKSLVSQLIYFFRDTSYLISNYSKESAPRDAVREVTSGLRSGRLTGRDLTTFISKGTVQVRYTQENMEQPEESRRCQKEISLNSGDHYVTPLGQFEAEIYALLAERFSRPSSPGKITPKAMFIPAERAFFSRFLNSDSRVISSDALPFTMLEFSDILAQGRDIYLEWQKQKNAPPEVNEIESLVKSALRGQVRYEQAGPLSGTWQWMPQDGERPTQIEMASSGQMEAWPMVFAAQTAFGRSDLERPTFIHIEEPEAHLHPAAQIAMVQLLAYLVNKGFRVIATTHSLSILYTLNNLMAAYQMLSDKKYRNVPPNAIRLNPKDVTAYLFTGEGVKEIMSNTDGLYQIDETQLGKFLGGLQTQLNQIIACATYQEKK